MPDEGQRELDVRVGLGLSATEDQLGSLLAIAQQVEVPAGHVVYARGGAVDSIFQLVQGAVELDHRAIEVGSSIGFADFLIGRPHTRTAIAVTATRLLQVDATDYRDYLEDNFELAYRMIVRASNHIAAKLAEQPQLLAAIGKPARSFADIEMPMVERLMLLSRIGVFRGGSMQALANLAQAATEVRFAPADEIVAAGPRSSAVWVLVEGEVELASPAATARRSQQELLADADELALTPRRCTITAVSPVIALRIEREDLLDLLEEHFDLVTAMLAYLAARQEQLDG